MKMRNFGKLVLVGLLSNTLLESALGDGVVASRLGGRIPVVDSGKVLGRSPDSEIKDKVVVDPKLVEPAEMRRAIPNKSYMLKDPTTGGGSEDKAKVIEASQILTLPNGKQVPAQQYYQELNKMEAYLNKMGHSLREAGEETELLRVKQDRGGLDTQRKNTLTIHKRDRIVKRLPVNQAQVAHNEAVRLNPALKLRLANIPDLKLCREGVPCGNGFSKKVTYSDSFGNPSSFSAYIDSYLDVSGNPSGTIAHGYGDAGGFMFGKKIDVIQGFAEAVNPKDGNQSGKVRFLFLGQEIHNQTYNGPAYFSSNKWTKSLDQSQNLDFALGPIPMTAKLGAKGSASLDYTLSLSPLNSKADATPAVDSNVYIQVGADIIVGGAGGGSDLVLLKDQLDLTGQLYVGVDSAGAFYQADLDAYNNLKALDGRTYAYVYLYVPRWGIPPWTKKTWDWTLFSWDGVTAQGAVMDFNKKSYMF